MLFEIRHHTQYNYSKPVLFEPHFLRLRPRQDPFQKILKFELSITPQPDGISHQLDLDGNTIHQVWFDGSSDKLEILSTALVYTDNTNPFNYLVCPKSALMLPMEYSEDVEEFLKPYIMSYTNSLELIRFAERMSGEASRQTISFLNYLAHEISHKFQKRYREDGEPHPPEQTLTETSGACRDFAVLFMETCRMLGLAARFVSGYYFEEFHDKQYLHSWAEVYIPGGGWRGFDPSTGLAVADRHIAVAASAVPRLSAPVAGIFVGDADSTLTVDIKISAL